METEQQPRIYNPFAVPLRSKKLDKFISALSKMQGEYQSVTANKINPAFKSKYADLDAILEEVRPLIAANGFCLSQTEECCDGATYLRTELLHTSEQFKASLVKIVPDKQTNQGYGSALTYKKRYSAATILGITVDSDPTDDDGEYGRRATERKEYKPSGTTPVKTVKHLSENEIEFIEKNLEGHEDIKRELLKLLKVKTLKECPKDMFDTIVEFIDAKIKEKSLP